MSLVDDSPVSSSSSDDFASFLDGELDSTSDTQPEEEEEEKEKNDDDDDDDDYDWDQDDHETYKSLIDRYIITFVHSFNLNYYLICGH